MGHEAPDCIPVGLRPSKKVGALAAGEVVNCDDDCEEFAVGTADPVETGASEFASVAVELAVAK